MGAFDDLPTMADVEADRVGKPLPKPRPSILVKADQRVAKATASRKLRAKVRKRDEQHCRSCGLPVFVAAANPLRRAHVHHIQFRSKGGANTPSNLVTVCGECHAKIHAHEIDVLGTEAKNVRFKPVR